MIASIKWGAIVGVGVYLAVLASTALSNVLTAEAGSGASVTEHPVLLIPVCLSIFLLIFAFSAAGFYTARETGQAGLGAVAGVVAFIVQYVLTLLGTTLAGMHVAATAPAQPAANPVGEALAAIVAILLDLGLAASIGWLGGRPGAARSPRRKTPAATVASMPPPEARS